MLNVIFTHENDWLLTDALFMEKFARTVGDGLFEESALIWIVAFGSPVLLSLIDMFLTSIIAFGIKDWERL